MGFYPINLNISGKKCLVAGGGKVALRKVKNLLQSEAEIILVAPKIISALKKLARKNKIKIKQRVFNSKDLTGVFLAIAATDSFKINKKISKQAQRKNILVNTVDQLTECSFFTPAVLRKGDLSISISTNGKSPPFSKKIKEELEETIPDDIAQLILKISILREIQTKKLTESERQRFWNKFFDFNLLKDFKSNCKILKKKIKKCL